jgi:hypothetical protein
VLSKYMGASFDYPPIPEAERLPQTTYSFTAIEYGTDIHIVSRTIIAAAHKSSQDSPWSGA